MQWIRKMRDRNKGTRDMVETILFRQTSDGDCGDDDYHDDLKHSPMICIYRGGCRHALESTYRWLPLVFPLVSQRVLASSTDSTDFTDLVRRELASSKS